MAETSYAIVWDDTSYCGQNACAWSNKDAWMAAERNVAGPTDYMGDFWISLRADSAANTCVEGSSYYSMLIDGPMRERHAYLTTYDGTIIAGQDGDPSNVLLSREGNNLVVDIRLAGCNQAGVCWRFKDNAPSSVRVGLFSNKRDLAKALMNGINVDTNFRPALSAPVSISEYQPGVARAYLSVPTSQLPAFFNADNTVAGTTKEVYVVIRVVAEQVRQASGAVVPNSAVTAWLPTRDPGFNSRHGPRGFYGFDRVEITSADCPGSPEPGYSAFTNINLDDDCPPFRRRAANRRLLA